MKSETKTSNSGQIRHILMESKSQRGVYMSDEIWRKLEQEAVIEDRSVNYIIEKMLTKAFK